ncbi:replication protein RepA [Bryobacter aggregatus]|uniref:replication protein RepA n=1 Tax=Bryobacter aggregatus TaxID=360054 RepID=UPI000567DC8B|nr:replication protein RepA [Bryobacter aggregatus]
MLVRAEHVLRESHGDLLISRYRAKQAEGIALVRSNRENGKQSLAFASRPFILCGLPIRKPPPDQLLFERRNGNFLLQITGHPHFGLPFGQDRLILIFLATLAVRQKSQVVRFRSAAELLDTFGMAKGGKEYRRIIAAFERIFGATMFFTTDRSSATSSVLHRSRFNFLREAEIWYSRPESVPDNGNSITLSAEFYAELTAHPIPTDLEAIKIFAAAPGLLDLFLWLSYRCYISKGPEYIPLFGPSGLTKQLGCIEYSRPSKFRATLEKWLQSIRSLWPQCPARICTNGNFLRIDRQIVLAPSPH